MPRFCLGDRYASGLEIASPEVMVSPGPSPSVMPVRLGQERSRFTMSVSSPRASQRQPRLRRAAIVASALVLATSAGCSKKSAHTETSPAPTTTKPAPSTTVNKLARIAPLTGLVDPTGGVAKRCAVTVKIGNTAEAHPQTGVGSADLVYEFVVDGGITRLAAVFQSHTPNKVGPLRSVRPSDQQVLWALGGVFAYSGGNAVEVASLQGVPVNAFDETRAGPMMFRDPARVAPHNLYAHVDQLFGACTSPPPQAPFGFRTPGQAVGGKPAATVTVGFKPPYAVTWTWDGKSGRWMRQLFGKPDLGASGGQLGVTNVVVLSVGYLGGAAGTDTEVQLLGSGPVSVYTAGRVITGTWSRDDKAQPVRLRDAAGNPIRLTPGTTWIELPDTSYPITTTP